MAVTVEQYADGPLAAGLPREAVGGLVGFGGGPAGTPLGDTDKLIGRTPTASAEFLAG